MQLGEAQRLFTLDVAHLIEHAYALGYAMTFGDAYRDPRVTYGHPNSVHRKRLAVDLNLFQQVNGVWLYRADTESHRPLGMFWKKLRPENRWGGDFASNPDGNHYSRAWEGVA